MKGLVWCTGGMILARKFKILGDNFFDILVSVHHNIIPSYSQQDATFLDLFISKDALHVSGGASAHHQEHKLYIQLQVLSTNTAASSYRGRDGTSVISSTVAAVQLCVPDDGRRNRLKHVKRL